MCRFDKLQIVDCLAKQDKRPEFTIYKLSRKLINVENGYLEETKVPCEINSPKKNELMQPKLVYVDVDVEDATY